MPDSPKTALITGGSSGIGFELAKIFAQNHYHLVLVANDKKLLEVAAIELDKISPSRVKIISVDLTKPSSTKKIIDELDKWQIKVDVLINSAGYATRGSFYKLNYKRQIDMIGVNITALTSLTHLLLTQMLERKTGKILNVASTAAFVPGPYMAVYYATKAYVLSFSKALAAELEGTGITVTTLCPGPTKSRFDQRAGVSNSKLFKYNLMDADRVAREAYAGLEKGKLVVIPGLRNNLIVFWLKFAPWFLIKDTLKRVHN